MDLGTQVEKFWPNSQSQHKQAIRLLVRLI